MLRSYKVFTVSHQTVEVGVLSDFVVPEKDGSPLHFVKAAKAHFDIEEVLYLQTCNRVMFLFYDNDDTKLPDVSDFFRYFHPEKEAHFYENLKDTVREYDNLAAVEHIFSVACSVDSLVVGEREILRQLREAFQACSEMKLTGDSIRLLMRFAVETAKQIYEETRIGEKSVSVASLAARMLIDKGLNPQDPILLIGAGETNTIIAKVLKKKGFHDVAVFNRTRSKADFLANLLGSNSYDWSDLPKYSNPWKAMIVCTAAQEPIINKNLFVTLDQSNTYDTKYILDLAIPRNVSDEVSSMDHVSYMEIESVRSEAEANKAFRKNEVKKAVEIIHQKGRAFLKIYQQRQIEKSLSTIPAEIHAIKQRALEEVFAKEVMNLDESTQGLIKDMLDYMEKKCVAIPMKTAKGII